MRCLAAAVLLVVLPMLSLPAEAAPKSKLWPRWTAHDAASNRVIDHGAWAKFLNTYLVADEDGLNRISYRRVTPADKQGLEDYLKELAQTPVSRLNRPEQLAYWINQYNALTIKVVLDHYPKKSILDIDISPGFFSVGPWGKKLATIEGENVSLDDIEHRIFRPIWRDPRIHYAVNCASVGCPNLQPVPFRGATVDRMLDAAARAFINGDRSVWFEDGVLGASSIYKWFSDDFGRNDREVIAHIAKFASTALRTRLKDKREFKYYNYDWSLNEPR